MVEDEDVSRAESRACRVLATGSRELLPSVWVVADVVPSGGPAASLSWMLENICWASDRLPDCRASDRLCRSLLNGSLLWPPFCDETSFCNAVRAVWASEVLPDCRALLRVFIRVEMSVEELSEEELS